MHSVKKIVNVLVYYSRDISKIPKDWDSAGQKAIFLS
jgi:hypothetical protein